MAGLFEEAIKYLAVRRLFSLSYALDPRAIVTYGLAAGKQGGREGGEEGGREGGTGGDQEPSSTSSLLSVLCVGSTSNCHLWFGGW